MQMQKVVRLETTKKTMKVGRGRCALVPLQVFNEGSVADRYQASVTGIPSAWYDLGATSGPDDGGSGLTILPGADERVQLTVQPPVGAATGTYTITICMTSKYDSHVSASTTVALTVKPRATWAVIIPPTVLLPALFVLAQGYAPTSGPANHAADGPRRHDPTTRTTRTTSTTRQRDATGVLIATAPPSLDILLNPNTVPFGNHQVRVTSAGRRIHLANTGSAPIHITRIVISGGDRGDFAQRNTCTRAVIAAADGCTITVSFRPTAGGTHSASLRITGTTSPL